MTLMEKTVHQKVHHLATMDRDVRKSATPTGMRLWNKFGVPAGVIKTQDMDALFVLADTILYNAICTMYDMIRSKYYA